MPNIYYRTGDVSAAVSGSVRSAIDRVAQLNYVDTSRMGIQGHSFGGFETAVITTHLSNFKSCAKPLLVCINSTNYYSHQLSNGLTGVYFST